MKKSSKGRTERRKNPRGKRPKKKIISAGVSPAVDECHHCQTKIGDHERALFVEEEVGRIFCSEKCITEAFAPEIEKLEKEYYRHLEPTDLSLQEREGLAHLRWITLQEPDEVWRQKTASGDYRYTLISRFEPGTKDVWSICICLFLRGEPSFLYIALTTRKSRMTDRYRRGERVEWIRGDETAASRASEQEGEVEPSNRLAEPWTADEMVRAQMGNERTENDIPSEDFSLYQECTQETLEDPDELWSFKVTQDSPRLFHFIRFFSDENPTYWYIVVAKETGESEEIEIVDLFPTRDVNLVNQFRRGEQEMSREDEKAAAASSRVVH